MAAILVVDDDTTNQKLMEVLLSLDGYELRTASNAAEARTILQNFKPDLILMDVQLPDTNGLTLTQELKAHPEYQDIKIVALTAFAMKGDEEKVLAAGCDGYIPKPISTESFPQIVQKFLTPA